MFVTIVFVILFIAKLSQGTQERIIWILAHINLPFFQLFRISEGKLLVKIHNTSALLETDDAFFVPYGNIFFHSLILY